MKHLRNFLILTACIIAGMAFVYSCGGGGGSNSPTLEATYTFDSADTPIVFDDNWPVGVFSEINVSGFIGSISKVTVQVDIDHSWVYEVVIELTSPAGTTVMLAAWEDFGGRDYSNTIFDDDATKYIGDSSAPFKGSYQPEEFLSAFNGEDPAGTWELTVYDAEAGDVGTLNYWRLGLD